MSTTFSFKELELRLINEFGYSPTQAQATCLELEHADQRIREALLHWFNTGKSSDMVVENYDLKRLKNEHGMNIIAGFLTLDWLIQEPKAALASLARGHDSIK